MRFGPGSSGEPEIEFKNGHVWKMPDMILHYVSEHEWLPPEDFVDDVMYGTFVTGRRVQSKGGSQPVKVGYLDGTYSKGAVPEGFLEKLETLVRLAEEYGK